MFKRDHVHVTFKVCPFTFTFTFTHKQILFFVRHQRELKSSLVVPETSRLYESSSLVRMNNETRLQGCFLLCIDCVHSRLLVAVTRANWCTRSKGDVKKKKNPHHYLVWSVWSTESVAEMPKSIFFGLWNEEIGPVDSSYRENWETKRKAVVNICHM